MTGAQGDKPEGLSFENAETEAQTVAWRLEVKRESGLVFSKLLVMI